MSIRIKKKSKIYKLIDEPKLIDMIILGFLSAKCLNLLLLDKIIHHQIMGRIRYHIKESIKKFRNQYQNILQIIPDRTKNLQIYHTQKGQIKLNIPIYFKISQLKKQTQYNLSYSYEINRKGKQKVCAWSGQFYITSKINRFIWLYKENHVYAQLPSYMMDILTVRSDDTLCVYLPFYNFGKQVKNIKFYALGASQYHGCECQVQKIYTWCQKYQKSNKNIDFNIEDITKGMPQQLRTLSIKRSNIENHYRIQLQCMKKFISTKFLDNVISCQGANQGVTITLKKKGCYNDENSIIELRVGDIMIIYFMKL